MFASIPDTHIYLDDLLVSSYTLEEHLDSLKQNFDLAKKIKLK